jgi:hypothetical protein
MSTSTVMPMTSSSSSSRVTVRSTSSRLLATRITSGPITMAWTRQSAPPPLLATVKALVSWASACSCVHNGSCGGWVPSVMEVW